jgi:hypothetical protein
MRFVYQLCAKILLNGCDTAADANVLILRSILRPPQHPSPAAASFARRSILRPLQHPSPAAGSMDAVRHVPESRRQRRGDARDSDSGRQQPSSETTKELTRTFGLDCLKYRRSIRTFLFYAALFYAA